MQSFFAKQAIPCSSFWLLLSGLGSSWVGFAHWHCVNVCRIMALVMGPWLDVVLNTW